MKHNLIAVTFTVVEYPQNKLVLVITYITVITVNVICYRETAMCKLLCPEGKLYF